jgi:hypothetical protein
MSYSILNHKGFIENDLKLVATWCFRNKLLINPEKTKFLLIGTRPLLGNDYLISWKRAITSSKRKRPRVNSR